MGVLETSLDNLKKSLVDLRVKLNTLQENLKVLSTKLSPPKPVLLGKKYHRSSETIRAVDLKELRIDFYGHFNQIEDGGELVDQYSGQILKF